MPRHDIVIDDAIMKLLKILLPYVTSLLDFWVRIWMVRITY